LTDRLILVGQIGQAHGLKGEVKLTSFTQDPESLIAYSPLLTHLRAPSS
jgi:16S rRNA processing protein RimM